MEVIRHGKYKSAVEPFLSNTMSDENREQITELLLSVWDTYLGDIAQSRAMTEDQLNTFADNLATRTPEMALANNFVDALAYADQYNAAIKANMGLSEDQDLNHINILDYGEYAYTTLRSKATDRIAVIYAQGEIGFGKGNDNYIGQDIMFKSLRDARDDDRVKAIVLRINSPGGMAITS